MAETYDLRVSDALKSEELLLSRDCLNRPVPLKYGHKVKPSYQQFKKKKKC